MSHTDRRHGDPEHGGLSSGEKAAVVRQVRAGEEVHLPRHPEHEEAARQYAKEVEAREGGKATGQAAHHGRGELSGAEKAAVTRAVHSGHNVDDLPFVQGHPKKRSQAQEYAEQVRMKAGDGEQ